VVSEKRKIRENVSAAVSVTELQVEGKGTGGENLVNPSSTKRDGAVLYKATR